MTQEHRQAVTPGCPRVHDETVVDGDVVSKNVRMIGLMKEFGYRSVNRFCKARGLNVSEVGNLINCKAEPRDSRGQWRSIALAVADSLACEPDDLWPGDLGEHPECGVSEPSVPCRSDAVSESERMALIEVALAMVSARLGTRVGDAIRMRFGLLPYAEAMTYEEIGALMGVSRDRARILVAHGLRRLRHPAHSEILRSLMSAEVVG